MKKQAKISALILILLLSVVGVYFFGYRLSPDDCTNYEKYDSFTGSCYFDCSSDQQCDETQAKVDAELDQFFEGSKSRLPKVEHDSKYLENSTRKSSGTTIQTPGQNLTLDDTESETEGTVYTVSGSQELSPEPTSDDLKLWQLFTKIASREVIEQRIQSFEVFSDESNDMAASVWQSQISPGKWHVNVNASFADDPKDMIHTMVHEFGHITTLNETQVDKLDGSCPTFEIPEGCSKPGSVIADFQAMFWSKSADNSEKSADYNESDFVSEYASSNVIEDLAESYAIFVLRPKPTGNLIKDQKIKKLYDYPELVEQRSRIRDALGSEIR